MQLLSISLYNANGERRDVEFRPGQMNVVTGRSATGKSALLTIVEYCLGRDSMRVPAGPITNTVVWYATLWSLDGDARAFVARPAPQAGRASTQQAMLEFGANDLVSLDLDDLEVNTDSASLREQLGRRIGIEENQAALPSGSLKTPLEANLGHATLLCLQAQGEIANPNVLFHRQGETGLAQAIQETLPYFLGAVPRNQALKRAQLRDARRDLVRLEARLRTAQEAAATIDTELVAALTEARTVGLSEVIATDRAPVVTALRAALLFREPAQAPLDDPEAQQRRAELERERDDLRAGLSALNESRRLLLDQGAGEVDYVNALDQQAGRLASLGLLGDEVATTDACPVCGAAEPEPTPTFAELSSSLETLARQVSDLRQARPRQRQALESLDEEIGRKRERLLAAEQALTSLGAASAVTDDERGSRDFVRGRIDTLLRRASIADQSEIDLIRAERQILAARIEALEGELDEAEEREQITSRLLIISRDMSTYATALELEHASDSVRLDLARLTVVTDSADGPLPLFRIGSAQNHIGYHLAWHLALHRYLTLQNRPVPRLLMIDQPTQAYYPSEVLQESGVAATDEDRLAVARIFELIDSVAKELAPSLQIIVSDHADLPDEWFREAVVHNWRDGEALIPRHWIDEIDGNRGGGTVDSEAP